MNAETMLERVRMCLAEAGYDPAMAMPCPIHEGHVATDISLPDFVAWKAAAVADMAQACWPCVRSQIEVDPFVYLLAPCDHEIDPFCPEDAEVPS